MLKHEGSNPSSSTKAGVSDCPCYYIPFIFLPFYVAGCIRLHSAIHRNVAQFGRASALGAEGRRFESCHSDQKINKLPSLIIAAL